MELTVERIFQKQNFGHRLAPQIAAISTKDGTFLAVKEINYSIELIKGFAEITQKITYLNSSSEVIDAGFVYPKSIKSSFSDMKIVTADKLIQAKLMERQEARRNFEEAKARKEVAIISEAANQQRMSDTVFTQIGNMRPGMEIRVEFSIVQRIDKSRNGEWSVKIPGQLRPLYPVGLSDVAAYCVSGSPLQRLFEDSSRKKARKKQAIRMNSYTLSSGRCPWNIEVIVGSNNKKYSCRSPTHHMIEAEDPQRGILKYILDPNKPQLVSKTFIFKFRDPTPMKVEPQLTKWFENQDSPYAFNLYVDLGAKEEEELADWDSDDDDDGFLDDDEDEIFKAEYIFLIDRSGSMAGKQFNSLKKP